MLVWISCIYYLKYFQGARLVSGQCKFDESANQIIQRQIEKLHYQFMHFTS